MDAYYIIYIHATKLILANTYNLKIDIMPTLQSSAVKISNPTQHKQAELGSDILSVSCEVRTEVLYPRRRHSS
jgi:hypothetical protein